MERITEIKDRRKTYLDSISNYIEGEHEKKRDEFLYFAEQDIEYLLSLIETQRKQTEQLRIDLNDIREDRDMYKGLWEGLTTFKGTTKIINTDIT